MTATPIKGVAYPLIFRKHVQTAIDDFVENLRVVTPKGVKLCRPSEVVLDLLDQQPASFTKEDGEVVILAPR